MKPLTVAILSCVLAGTAVLSAQLGDVARKEAERRKGVKTAGKTYTNETLPAAPTPSSAPATPSSTSGGGSTSTASSSGSASSSTDKTADDKTTDKGATDKASDKAAGEKTDKPAQQVSSDPAERKKEEAQWRERIKGERDGLERSRSFAEALQSRINALNTDFVNRDDPQQRTKIAADRDKALADLETAKKEIDKHTKALTQIQDEARRAGAPAGWVR